MHKLFFQSSYFSTKYSIRTWTNTQKHVFIKLRFTHPKPIWFLLSKLPNFTKLSISSILFNDFSFSHHITIKLLTKMFLIYFLYAKNSFPVTHIYDPFKRAYHSMSDLSPKGKKYGVLWKLNGLCRIRYNNYCNTSLSQCPPPYPPRDPSNVTHMTLDWLTVDIGCISGNSEVVALFSVY